MDEPITGGCGCGAVQYEVSEPFVSASYCHCTRCQRRSGTPWSLNARSVPGAVRVTAGEDELRVWAPEGGFEKLFCGRCGSALFSRPPGSDVYLSVRLGTVDGDPGIRPQWHAFTANAPAWHELPDDGLPRFPGAKPA